MYYYFQNTTLAETCCSAIAAVTILNTAFATNCSSQCNPGSYWPNNVSTELYAAYSASDPNDRIKVVELTNPLPVVNHTPEFLNFMKHRQTLIVPQTCSITLETINAWRDSPFLRAAAILKNTAYTFESDKTYAFLAFHGITLVLGLLFARVCIANRSASASTA